MERQVEGIPIGSQFAPLIISSRGMIPAYNSAQCCSIKAIRLWASHSFGDILKLLQFLCCFRNMNPLEVIIEQST
jgi:hypothetical protein